MIKFIIALKLVCLTACASQGGIGVGFDANNIIRVVIENSPAEAADIRVGDQLLAPLPRVGRIGSMCLVRAVRDSTVYEKQVKRVNVETLKRKWQQPHKEQK